MSFILKKQRSGMHLAGKKEQRYSRKHRLSRELAEFGKRLHTQGLVAATDGNLSVRLEDGSIMITPTGFSNAAMKPSDMVVVDLSGNKISGSNQASSELELHLTIYRIRLEIGAVVHAHPCTATAFAVAGLALDEPLCSEAVITLGNVPLAPYATPGSQELSESLKPFVAGHEAILMANHGAVTYARDLRRAYMMMEAVEHYARIVLATRHLGAAHALSHDDREKLLEARTRYLAKSTV
jgi:L-fuculose-phosphate aldolase